ncbi:hypothetical protein T492DRAFT_896338 [Pavlovales sp. CCMP2436]|nr:hypothetical protein T492DRAFT_896338 [Pavlovales sp. CCMP2436]
MYSCWLPSGLLGGGGASARAHLSSVAVFCGTDSELTLSDAELAVEYFLLQQMQLGETGDAAELAMGQTEQAPLPAAEPATAQPAANPAAEPAEPAMGASTSKSLCGAEFDLTLDLL